MAGSPELRGVAVLRRGDQSLAIVLAATRAPQEGKDVIAFDGCIWCVDALDCDPTEMLETGRPAIFVGALAGLRDARQEGREYQVTVKAVIGRLRRDARLEMAEVIDVFQAGGRYAICAALGATPVGASRAVTVGWTIETLREWQYV